MPLSAKQRAHLRSAAHHLKPIFQIGKEGVSESAVQAVEDAFNTRELLKVKIQEAAPLTAREAGSLLSERISAVEHVQTIGRTIVLYRVHPEKPQIKLPRE
ncbi:YhbY family RNA-binding protein [soil metagenome]